jgi:hypothetical protein
VLARHGAGPNLCEEHRGGTGKVVKDSGRLLRPHSPIFKNKGPCCPVCGQPVSRWLIGRRKRFCSAACRLEAHRTKKIGNLTHGEGLQRNGCKSACGPRGNCAPNPGRPPDIRAPRRVIEAELGGGRVWIETVSSDGVKSLVTGILPAALIEARQRGHVTP